MEARPIRLLKVKLPDSWFQLKNKTMKLKNFDLIGLTVLEARELLLPTRQTVRATVMDGVEQRDFYFPALYNSLHRPERINVEIKDGVIVKIISRG